VGATQLALSFVGFVLNDVLLVLDKGKQVIEGGFEGGLNWRRFGDSHFPCNCLIVNEME
jgi:hypothetical protein